MASSPAWKIGSFFSNVATKLKTVVEEEQQHIRSFLSENEEVKKKEEESKLKEQIKTLHPPWEDLSTSDPKVAEEVRTQIMNLTKSKRNFLNAPPEDANFDFDFETSLPIAQVSLKSDPALSNARFYLVPKYIKEPQFWRNYFYRVWIIKQAYGLNTMNNNEEPTPTPAAPLTLPPVKKDQLTSDQELEEEMEKELRDRKNSEEDVSFTHGDDEFVSDAFGSDVDFSTLTSEKNYSAKKTGNNEQTAARWEAEMKAALQEDDSADVEIDEAWEAEMRKELEEIND